MMYTISNINQTKREDKMIPYELSNEQFELLANLQPFWLADNYPRWLADNRPFWLADNRPMLMFALEPCWMCENRMDWVKSFGKNGNLPPHIRQILKGSNLI